MKITPSECLSKLCAEYRERKDFIFIRRSKEPAQVTESSVNTVKGYYNGLIQYHLTLRDPAVKANISSEIARVRSWLDKAKANLGKEKSLPSGRL